MKLLRALTLLPLALAATLLTGCSEATAISEPHWNACAAIPLPSPTPPEGRAELATEIRSAGPVVQDKLADLDRLIGDVKACKAATP